MLIRKSAFKSALFLIISSTINAMADIVTSRDVSRVARVPDPVIYLLVCLTVLGSFIVGYGKKKSSTTG